METLVVIQSLFRIHNEITLIDASIVSPDALASKSAIRNTVYEFKAAIAKIAELLDSASKEIKTKKSKAAVYYGSMMMNTITFDELKEGSLQAIAEDIRELVTENKDAIDAENKIKLAKALENVAKSEARLKMDKEALKRAQKRVKLMELAVQTFGV